MTRSLLLCCTSIIRSSPLVQASSSLSMICARAWPTVATRQRNPFPPFFARVKNLRKKRKRQQRKVGREEEGSSSKRPKLAVFILALCGTPVATPMLYLCDNQALLKAIKRWVGEGGKATLVARRRHFIGSNRRASKKDNSRSSDVSGQHESASRRTCKRRRRHPSRQGYFRQRCSHGMARQDKSSSLHVARVSLERRYGEHEDWKSTWNSGVWKAIRRGISRRGGAQTPGSCDRSLETNQQTKRMSRCKL